MKQKMRLSGFPILSHSKSVAWGRVARKKKKVLSFTYPFFTPDFGKRPYFSSFLWAPLPYQGYSQDAEGDANTNIHPTNMFSGEEEQIETHICVISGQEQMQSTLGQSKILKKFTFESIDTQ